MAAKNYHGPPLGLGSFFEDSSSDEEQDSQTKLSKTEDEYLESEGEVREYTLVKDQPPIKIREFAFHSHNANFVWKGNEEFAAWMLANSDHLHDKRILELACGTGILAIFMRQQAWNITSSDYKDGVISRNMTYNLQLNGMDESDVPHLPYTWGEPFPTDIIYDIVIANDILIYESTYQKLADSIKQILSMHPRAKDSPYSPIAPHFYLGHKRRVKAKPSFFDIIESSGMFYKKIANYIYDITLVPHPSS